jgi:hypothetical protein
MEARFFIPILAVRELVFVTITINKLAVMRPTPFSGCCFKSVQVVTILLMPFSPFNKIDQLNFQRRSDRSQVEFLKPAADQQILEKSDY